LEEKENGKLAGNRKRDNMRAKSACIHVARGKKVEVLAVRSSWARVKEILHNTAAHLAVPFSISAACRFLDLPPVNLRNLQLHLSKNSLAI